MEANPSKDCFTALIAVLIGVEREFGDGPTNEAPAVKIELGVEANDGVESSCSKEHMLVWLSGGTKLEGVGLDVSRWERQTCTQCKGPPRDVLGQNKSDTACHNEVPHARERLGAVVNTLKVHNLIAGFIEKRGLNDRCTDWE